MPVFYVRYALGGGFGGCEMAEWEVIEANSEEDATDYAWERAKEVYESYEGLYGLRTVEEIMEEDECDEEAAIEIYSDEREHWLEYEVSKAGRLR